MTLGMCGEVGEVANIVKKIHRNSASLDDAAVRTALGMEIADVFIYLLNLCALLNFDLQDLYNRKTAYNEERFTKQRAQRQQALNRERD